jgi:hypothetical protein
LSIGYGKDGVDGNGKGSYEKNFGANGSHKEKV